MPCQHCCWLYVGPSSNEDFVKVVELWKSGDHTTVVQLLMPFAESGSVLAQCIVGGLLHVGLGVEWDYVKAEQMYLAAANKGCVVSWNNLASLYATQGKKDSAKECYRDAVRLGFCEFPPDYYDNI